MSRPPSVDALARSLTGLPHPLAVDIARQAISDGAVAEAPAQGGGAAPHVAHPGRQRHGRAAAHQPRPGAARPPPGRQGAVARARPGDRRARLAPACRRPALRPAVRGRGGDDRQQQRRRRPPRARRPRRRPCRAGESRRERGDRRRVPRARGDGAVGRRPRRCRHHQPHPPRRLSPGGRPATTSPSFSRCTRATTASTGSSRTRRSPSWRRSARPLSSTSAAACSTRPARGGRVRTRRRGWPASRLPCRRSPPAPPSSRSAATSCSAGRRPGSSPGAATSSSGAAVTRSPAPCAQAGSSSPPCRTSPSPTSAATS